LAVVVRLYSGGRRGVVQEEESMTVVLGHCRLEVWERCHLRVWVKVVEVAVVAKVVAAVLGLVVVGKRKMWERWVVLEDQVARVER